MTFPFKMQENFFLKDYNSFRLNIKTNFFIKIVSIQQLKELIRSEIFKSSKVAVLGRGSNVLFSGHFDGVLVKIDIKGIQIVRENQKSVHMEIGAGEDWPKLVKKVVELGWGGIENLAMVPGTAGAAPIQNIACYGHNFNERLVSVDALDIKNGNIIRFKVSECKLGYRDSIFKNELKGKCIITKIRLRLDKNPVLNTSYKSRYESVEEELSRIAAPPYNVRDVYRAICNIRERKLPDITKIGSAGSVFKNPIVYASKYDNLKRICPGLHFYPIENLSYSHLRASESPLPERVKIPAAWLIENMGWAGKRIGDCGIWKTQPLNIVNYGNASPKELMKFIDLVRNKVFDTYGVALEPEVEVF